MQTKEELVKQMLDKNPKDMERKELEEAYIQLVCFVAGLIYGINMTKEEALKLIKTL